jgi:small subunit ribosomal protein S2
VAEAAIEGKARHGVWVAEHGGREALEAQEDRDAASERGDKRDRRGRRGERRPPREDRGAASAHVEVLRKGEVTPAAEPGAGGGETA